MLHRRMMLGQEEEEVKKLMYLGEVALEEDSSELIMDGLDCIRIVAEVSIPAELESTSYNYGAFKINDKTVTNTNTAIYAGQNSMVCFEAELIENAVLYELRNVNGDTSRYGGNNHSDGIYETDIERINELKFMHGCTGAVLPAGTTMKVWGY